MSEFVVKVNIQYCHHGRLRVHPHATIVVQDWEDMWSMIVPWQRHLVILSRGTMGIVATLRFGET